MKKHTHALLFSALVTGVMSPAGEAASPNVVIFYADDLGYGDLASFGHPVVQTPNIDRLANDGIRYTQYYAPAPLSSPSRAGLLTARTPYRTGIKSWIPEGQNVHLGKNELTLAHLLKQQGYRTAIMGKLHLNGGADLKSHPQAKDMGFDYSFVLPYGYVDNQKIYRSPERPRTGKMYPDGFWRNGKPVGETRDFSGELVASEAISWLEKSPRDTPFFLYVPFTEVHTPIASPQAFRDRYSSYITEHARRNPDTYLMDWVNEPYRGKGEYYANISYLDHQVGRIMEKIRQMGAEDNTIFVFASDNGPVTDESRKDYELNIAGETNGLRGRKDNLYEGGIRVPAIIKYTPLIKPGQSSHEVVTGLDIVPTLAEIIGFDMPADRAIDGQSVLNTFKGLGVTRIRPFIWSIDMPGENEWAIREGDWKLLIDREGKAVALYNLRTDLYETTNLLGKNTRIQTELMKKYLDYRYQIENDSLKLARENQ